MRKESPRAEIPENMRVNRMLSGKERIVRILSLITILSLTALLYTCGAGDTGCKSDPVNRQFWVFDTTKNYDTDPSAWLQIDTEKLAESKNAVVYVDINEGVSTSTAQDLADAFDAHIYDNVTTYFASPLDVDGNCKTILVVFDIIDSNYYSGHTGPYIGGYFFSLDMYSQASVEATWPGTPMHSNEGDILFIDCNPQNPTTEDAERTIAHEFQHLVNFSNVVAKNKDLTDTWIDEGLAEAANHLCYGQVQDRIDFYNTDTGNIIKNGSPLFYWDNSHVLTNYSKSYLFFQYMRGQSALGNGIYKKIIDSNFGDFRAIQDAMTSDSNLSTTTTWGATADDRFNRLVLRWYVANNIMGTSSNILYTYNGAITGTLTQHLYTTTSVSGRLSGAGVVKSMNQSFSVVNSDYVYMSINGDGSGEDFDSGYLQRGYFVAVYIVYNTGGGSSSSTGLPTGIILPDIADGSSMFGLKAEFVSPPDKPQKMDLLFPKGLAEKLRGLK